MIENIKKIDERLAKIKSEISQSDYIIDEIDYELLMQLNQIITDYEEIINRDQIK
jgi:hypothetical protein